MMKNNNIKILTMIIPERRRKNLQDISVKTVQSAEH